MMARVNKVGCTLPAVVGCGWWVRSPCLAAPARVNQAGCILPVVVSCGWWVHSPCRLSMTAHVTRPRAACTAAQLHAAAMCTLLCMRTALEATLHMPSCSLQVVATAQALLANGGVMAPVGMHIAAMAAK